MEMHLAQMAQPVQQEHMTPSKILEHTEGLILPRIKERRQSIEPMLQPAI
jgi:hypothetical protein